MKKKDRAGLKGQLLKDMAPLLITFETATGKDTGTCMSMCEYLCEISKEKKKKKDLWHAHSSQTLR